MTDELQALLDNATADDATLGDWSRAADACIDFCRTERPALIAERDALQSAGEKLQDEALAMADRAANLERERDALREALAYYGGHDPDNSDHGDWLERMNEDGGDVARAALGASHDAK